jgi:hypothetical protein
MKTEPKTSPEFDNFRNFVKAVISVPHSEIKAKLDEEKKSKERKKRAKASPASRASSVRDL